MLNFWRCGVGLVGALWIGACGSSPDDQAPVAICQTSIECELSEMCVGGLCVDPPNGSTAAPTRPPWTDGGTVGVPPFGATCSLADCDAGAALDGGGSKGPLMLQRLPVEARSLVADRARRRIYASVSGGASRYANQLVTFDGTTGEVRAAVHVGSDPSALAMADDGSALWVSLTGAQTIRRVDLTTDMPTPAEQHVLPADQRGEPTVPGRLLALPGQPRSVVVMLTRSATSPRFAGLLVLDDGVMRPLSVVGSQQASIFVVGGPNLLFGYNNENTGFEFEVVSLGPSTRTHTQHRGLIQSFDNDIVYADQRVFANTGEVLDVSMPATPKRAGRFAASGAFVQPVDALTPLMLSRSIGGRNETLALHLLDTATFTIKRSVPVGGLDGGHDSVRLAVQADPASVFFLVGSSYPGTLGFTYLLKATDGRPLTGL
jgi:hypothetical protein